MAEALAEEDASYERLQADSDAAPGLAERIAAKREWIAGLRDELREEQALLDLMIAAHLEEQAAEGGEKDAGD